jgi:hypothetical protein
MSSDSGRRHQGRLTTTTPAIIETISNIFPQTRSCQDGNATGGAMLSGRTTAGRAMMFDTPSCEIAYMCCQLSKSTPNILWSVGSSLQHRTHELYGLRSVFGAMTISARVSLKKMASKERHHPRRAHAVGTIASRHITRS